MYIIHGRCIEKNWTFFPSSGFLYAPCEIYEFEKLEGSGSPIHIQLIFAKFITQFEFPMLTIQYAIKSVFGEEQRKVVLRRF